MIRWRFVLTRLLILLAILMLARWSMGPLIRYASIKALETSVGAKAEIAGVRVGLFPPRIQYVDVQVADPRAGKEFVNVFSAETIDLAIDGDALLHRRFVARNGRIAGMRIGGRRATSGHLPRSPEPAPKGPSVVDQLLKSLEHSAGEKMEAFVGDLETVRQVHAIRSRWESDYADLSNRAKALETEVRAIRDQAKGIDNPLRDLPRIQSTLQRAEGVAQESLAIRRTVDQLPMRAHDDWAALEQAKEKDLQRINHYLPVKIENLHDVGPDLVRASIRQQIDRVRGYLDSGRQIAAWTVTAPKIERQRGEEIALNRSPLPPGLLLQRSELSGILSVDGESFTMTGILENITPQTDRLQQPMRARLRLEGPRVARVEFKRFYDEQVDGQPVRDQVTVHWPSLAMPRSELGDPEKAHLTIGGGTLELYVQIDAVGERLSGRLISKQTGTRFHLHVTGDASKLAMARSLQESLAKVDRVEVEAKFAGTWRDLEMDLATNLSKTLGRSLREAADAQVQETTELLTKKVEAVHRQETQELQAWLNRQHSKANELLAKTNQEIDAIREKLAGELPGAGAYTGRIGSLLQGMK